MASTTTSGGATQQRPPFWRDERILKILGQVVAVLVVVLTLRWLFGNLIDNLNRLGIDTGFGVLRSPAGFQVRDAFGFDQNQPIFPDLLWLGIRNTAVSAVVGIAIAVILGTLIGIGRLSTNWLVKKMAMIYVEVFRNIPPLVILIFIYAAAFVSGPLPAMNPTSAPIELSVPGTDNTALLLSNDRWGIPSFATTDGSTSLFWIGMLVGLVAAAAVWRWRTKVNIDTGAPHRRVLFSFLTLLAIAIVFFLIAGNPYRMSWPTVSENGRRMEGGIATNSAYISLTVGLGLYTASHVAEIIRGSILAIHRGQTEASNALALSGFQRYRFVILPQAMRIAIPALINQFLNLTKNTSLGTAVAYADVTALTATAIGNGKPAVQMLLVLMIIYLMFSFGWSLILNVVNRRFQFASR